MIISSFLNPRDILSHIGIGARMTVADLGCGGHGHFAMESAKMVGKDGLVYALDIFKPALSGVLSKARMVGLDNVKAVWSDLEIYGAAKTIKDQSLDIGLLINTLHQSKKRIDVLKEALRMIKPGGKLVVIDWENAHPSFGPKKDDIVFKDKLGEAGSKLGLKELESFQAGPYHYGIVFEKST